jgi:hypothetical protein
VSEKKYERLTNLIIGSAIGGGMLLVAMYTTAPQPLTVQRKPIVSPHRVVASALPSAADQFDPPSPRSVIPDTGTTATGDSPSPASAAPPRLAPDIPFVHRPIIAEDDETSLVLTPMSPVTAAPAADDAMTFVDEHPVQADGSGMTIAEATPDTSSPASPEQIPDEASPPAPTLPSLPAIAEDMYHVLRDCQAADARSLRLAVETGNIPPPVKTRPETAVLRVNYPDQHRLVAAEHYRGTLWGHIVLFHPAEHVMLRARFEKGRLNGLLTTLNQQGEVVLVQHYAEGTRHGSTCWFQHGEPRLIIKFASNEPQAFFFCENSEVIYSVTDLATVSGSLPPALQVALEEASADESMVYEALKIVQQAARDYEHDCRRRLAATRSSPAVLPSHATIELPFQRDAKLIEFIRLATEAAAVTATSPGSGN